MLLKSDYFRKWREDHPNQWHLIQLKHYYKNRKRIKTGFQKPKGIAMDEFDEWQIKKDESLN